RLARYGRGRNSRPRLERAWRVRLPRTNENDLAFMTSLTDFGLWEQRVRVCNTFEQLRQVREDVQSKLDDSSLWADFAAWMQAVNDVHDGILQRTIAISERILQTEHGLRV